MIVDPSALIAILEKEPEAERLKHILILAGWCRLSAASLLEASMVVQSRYGSSGVHDFDKLISSYEIEIEPCKEQQVMFARIAFEKYGKGQHKAKLNFGDCISYALAKDKGEPLLYKGSDFSQTDIEGVKY